MSPPRRICTGTVTRPTCVVRGRKNHRFTIASSKRLSGVTVACQTYDREVASLTSGSGRSQVVTLRMGDCLATGKPPTPRSTQILTG